MVITETGKIWRTDVYRQKGRHSEWVSDVYLGYLQFNRHLPDCTRFPSKSLYITDIKIIIIMNAERVDVIKATSIRPNKNPKSFLCGA